MCNKNSISQDQNFVRTKHITISKPPLNVTCNRKQITILVKINYCRLQNHVKQYNLASDHMYILPHPLLLSPSSFYYLISYSGILLVHQQSCFASAAPLPSFISSQPSILALSLEHRQPQLSNRLSVTWSPPAHVSWYCTSYPVFSLRAECRKRSESLCSLTLPRSVMFESTQLPIICPQYECYTLLIASTCIVYMYYCVSIYLYRFACWWPTCRKPHVRW